MPGPLSPHDALIYVMVTIAAVDRNMSDKEMSRIGNIVSQLPIFSGFNLDDLVRTAEACGHVLSKDGGLDQLLDDVAETLQPNLRETAYALAVEVAAADLRVGQEELRFLQMLRDRLRLDALAVAAIERSARVRHMVV